MGSGPAPPPTTGLGGIIPGGNQAAGSAMSGAESLVSGPFANITGLAGNVNSTVNPLLSLFPQGFNQGVGAAQQVSPYLTAAGYGALGTGANVNAAGNSLIPYATSIENLGLDPQSALFSQLQSQVQNQTGAGLANSGVLNSPYGQSVLGTTLGNFDTAWQNNLLSRAEGAGQTAAGLVGQAGASGGQALGLGTGGAGAVTSAGTLPFMTGAGITGSELGALSGAAGAGNQFASLPQMSTTDFLNYLQAYNQSQQIGNQSSIGGYNAQTSAATAQNQMFGALGAGGIQALNLFGAQGPFGPSGAFSGVGSGIAGLGSGMSNFLGNLMIPAFI